MQPIFLARRGFTAFTAFTGFSPYCGLFFSRARLRACEVPYMTRARQYAYTRAHPRHVLENP